MRFLDLFTNLIVTNRNEIPPKLNDYSRLYFQILYFQRQQYSLSLLFYDVTFFFPIEGRTYFPQP